MSSPPVDFGRAAADYGRYRQGFPPAFFARLDGLGVARPGERALDLGTGTGLMARELARRGCKVTGLDLSRPLLDEARRQDREAGLSIGYVLRPAEATGFPDASFDLVTAATAWHWFDRPRAAAEARRVLVPGGRLLLADLGWWPISGGVIEATWQVIDRFSPVPSSSPRAGGALAYPTWPDELVAVGFSGHELFGFTAALAYTHEAWRGRVRASARVGPAMDAAHLAAFDGELERVLRAAFPGDPLAVEHRVAAIVAW